MARLRAAVLILVAAATGILAAPASARTTKGCPPPIHVKRWGSADHIRVTKSFPCKLARQSIKFWLQDGAPGGPTNRELKPWRCNFHLQGQGFRGPIRCKIRTSFGGTKPLRTYRMRFVYDLRS